jgi:hypothetical protein
MNCVEVCLPASMRDALLAGRSANGFDDNLHYEISEICCSSKVACTSMKEVPRQLYLHHVVSTPDSPCSYLASHS